ncbi:ATP-binding protein [Vibrio sp. 99-70-13A1]|uniref:sensor histidine kinase n=1 Tax=Vibrio sp. 99-70-13A1 TaxID=2607601 RepID=UPI0031F2EBD2
MLVCTEFTLSVKRLILLKPFFILSLILGGIGLCATHHIATQYQDKVVSKELKDAANKANLQIESELAKFKQIPNLLRHDPRLLSYLTSNKQNQNLNELLLEWSNQSLADAIYIHDRTGTVIASSNYLNPRTFLGENFAFRPYFSEAIQGNQAQYVALGALSNIRGYFISSPLTVDGEIEGVITVKVSLENIEVILASDNFEIMILDSNKIVFLSTNKRWLYQAFRPLNESQQVEVNQNRQYGRNTIQIINEFQTLIASNASVPHSQLLSHHAFKLYPIAVENNDYQVIALKEARIGQLKVLQADFIFFIIYSLLALIAWSWRQTYTAKIALTDLNKHLEHTVDKRTQYLQHSNQQLQKTIFQYQESKLKLKQTEQELTQTAKLAVLGELSASINHEINQPLAALRTYSENSLKLLEMNQIDMVKGNLQKMIELNLSIGEIIARLKVFTRKVTQQEHHVANLHDAVNNATSILSAAMIKQGITLRLSAIPENIILSIHPTELEQVLVNLIHNAAQALIQHPSPQIGIDWDLNHDKCELVIWDNGPGIAMEQLPKLFDPFFTTKPEGLGLGLSISKRIIEAYSGEIQAKTREPSGMQFSLFLTAQTVINRTNRC